MKEGKKNSEKARESEFSIGGEEAAGAGLRGAELFPPGTGCF